MHHRTCLEDEKTISENTMEDETEKSKEDIKCEEFPSPIEDVEEVYAKSNAVKGIDKSTNFVLIWKTDAKT